MENEPDAPQANCHGRTPPPIVGAGRRTVVPCQRLRRRPDRATRPSARAFVRPGVTMAQAGLLGTTCRRFAVVLTLAQKLELKRRLSGNSSRPAVAAFRNSMRIAEPTQE